MHIFSGQITLISCKQKQEKKVLLTSFWYNSNCLKAFTDKKSQTGTLKMNPQSQLNLLLLTYAVTVKTLFCQSWISLNTVTNEQQYTKNTNIH